MNDLELNEPIEKYNSNRDFTSLEAWKKAHHVKLFFYKEVIPKLPPEEKYNLNIQIRKASISGTANLAEGYGRYHYQEGIQFYRTSRASIYELKDHLISCFSLEYVNQELYDRGILLIEDAKITINGFIKFVKNQIIKEK
jgi:four helix bundle protein